MFWKLGFNNQKAPLEALLEREDVKLEEVLDQDDFLQEAKGGNDKLIQFLTQPEIVRKLLQFTTETVNGDDGDDKRRFKFQYLACELLVADIPHIDAAVVETKEHLKMLFDFLVQPPPLPQSLALYFVRVLQTLYTKKPQEVTRYMVFQDGAFALNFIRHIETFGMNELILTLLGAMDDENRLQNGCSMSDWWMMHSFVPELFRRLTPQCSADVHINIIRMLCELVRRFNNPNVAHLADSLMIPEAARQLMSLMLDDLKLDSRSIIFTEGANLVISIIDSLVRKEDACRQMREKLQQMDCTNSQDLGTDVEHRVNLTFQAFMEGVPELVGFLRDPGPLDSMELTWATLSPPLGLARLKAVELLLVMMKTKRRFIEDAMVSLGLVNICLDLFFTYDMNNLLHILVDEIVTSCLVSDNAELISSLFNDCRLLERILLAMKEECGGSADRPQAMRKGYFGHITSISNKIHQASEQQALVRQFTQPSGDWWDFVHSTLAARNSLESMALGGASSSENDVPLGDVLDPSYPAQPSEEDLSPVDTAAPKLALPPTLKYAVTSGDGDTDMWEVPDETDRQGDGGRDSGFDARDAFLDHDAPEQCRQEEVWQERQIVDHSGEAAGDADWGRFDDPAPPVAPEQTAHTPYGNGDDYSSSSSDEDPGFSHQHSHTSATSPPVTHLPAESPPITAPTPTTLFSPVPNVVTPQGNPEEDAPYSDFNFWRPNWGDVSMAAR